MLARADNVPDGLSGPTVHGWLSGDIKTARRDYLDFVLETWRSVSRKVPITGDIRHTLLAEKSRTGCGADQLFNAMKNKPKGLSAGAVGNWFTGATKNARADHLRCVINAYAQLPDSAFRTHDARRSRHIHGERIRITPEIVEELKGYQDKSGFGPTALLKGRPDCPAALTANRVYGWLVGRIKSARQSELDYLRRVWPGAQSPDQVPLTPELRAKLRAMKESTGTGEIALLSGQKRKPEGLSASVIASWLNGSTKSANKAHLDYVIGLWSKASPYIPISADMRGRLTALKTASGLTWVQLHRELPSMRDKPSASMLAYWANGHLKTARANGFEGVIEWLTDQPQITGEPSADLDRKPISGRRTPITPEIRKRLNDARALTGDWKSLLNFLAPCPKDLTPQAISKWATGTLRSAPSEQLLFVLDGLKALHSKSINR
jgi:hypothetical protein